MALNIKDAEADRLIRELASVTGESITEAARRAFEERLRRVRAQQAAAHQVLGFDDIIARARSRTIIDDRPSDAILGYDENGLPQ